MDMKSNPEKGSGSIQSKDITAQADTANSDSKGTQKIFLQLKNSDLVSCQEKNKNCNTSDKKTTGKAVCVIREVDRETFNRNLSGTTVIQLNGRLTVEEFEEEKRKRNINTRELEQKLEICAMIAWKLARFFNTFSNVPSDEQPKMGASLELPLDLTKLRPRIQKEMIDSFKEELSSVSAPRVAKRSPEIQSLNEGAKRVRTGPEIQSLNEEAKRVRTGPEIQSLNEGAKRVRTESESELSEFSVGSFDSLLEQALQFSETMDDPIPELDLDFFNSDNSELCGDDEE